MTYFLDFFFFKILDDSLWQVHLRGSNIHSKVYYMFITNEKHHKTQFLANLSCNEKSIWLPLPNKICNSVQWWGPDHTSNLNSTKRLIIQVDNKLPIDMMIVYYGNSFKFRVLSGSEWVFIIISQCLLFLIIYFTIPLLVLPYYTTIKSVNMSIKNMIFSYRTLSLHSQSKMKNRYALLWSNTISVSKGRDVPRDKPGQG